MPYYTGLARVAAKTGYPVVERSGWKTRGHGPMGAVRSIIAHHTAGAAAGDAPSLGVVQSGRAGLPGPLAHFVLGRSGTIYVVAAGLAFHAGKVGRTAHANQHAIGIEAENTGRGEPWTDRQLDAYVKLCAALVAEFKLTPTDVLGHKEIAVPAGRKIDPAGITMADFRAAVKRGYWIKPEAAKPVAAVKPKPVPAKPAPAPAKAKAWPDADLPATSAHTAASHQAWVTLLDAAGFKDKDLGKAMQRWLRGLGQYPAKYLLDGIIGKASVKGLQRFLRKKGHYKGLATGRRDAKTIRAEIAYLNAQRKYL